ncbi:hypothetical protein [Rouxiella sp. Mn2063]|uniref:hypothetical protein n=1 Tax=Rouxiella sp. Mn2063 TaxID=3395262 RepID=UPI003BE131C8
MKSIKLLLLTTLFAFPLSFSPYALSNTVQEVNDRLDMLYGSHSNYHDFFETLKQSVTQRNKEQVAEMVSYPLKVNIKGKKVVVKNNLDFIKNYSDIVTPNIAKAITTQKYTDLFSRDTGIMIGQHGEVWFSGICNDSTCKNLIIKVIAINN